MPRIVSLIASATEIVAALGLEDSLVGRSHECDYPPTVHHLPVTTAPRFDVTGPSREIDRNVKDLLQKAVSIYQVDERLLRELRPDFIITQTQCEVCAVSEKDVENALCGWIESRPRIVSLAPNALADVWDDIRRVAVSLDVAERGRALIDKLQTRIDDIARRARAPSTRPTVACLEWLDPLMAGGNWVPELVELAGGVNLFGQAGKHAPWMSWDDLVNRDPDIIIALPCGFDLERTRQELTALSSHQLWGELRAVRAGKVFVTDGNQYFNRPGPRLVESLEIMAEIVHPERFQFGHEGTGFQSFHGAQPALPSGRS